MTLTKLKGYNTDDTITAIATFPSTAALGIIKISGKQALRIISKIFLSPKKKNIKKVKTYTLHYGWIIDKAKNEKRKAKNEKNKTSHALRPTSYDIIDEVLVSVMRAPNSYTREDVVEISCHGGVLALNKILEVILSEGGRLAEPGEFTYRAFLNGRINLLQAQSILTIVEAKSDESLVLAARQLKGQSQEKLKELRELIKEIFIETEAAINFPEDELKIDIGKIKEKIKILEQKLGILLEASNEARLLKEGLRCVICGKTNVGKSTLFNCLLGTERVIVSECPGTTRDVIEEAINIRGVPLRIYDTAGILTPGDLLDKKAIEKSSQSFEAADLVILVLDGSRLLDSDDLFLLEKIKKRNAKNSPEKNAIIVINKSDLKQKLDIKKIRSFGNYKVKLSALKNKGIKALEEAVFKLVYKKGIKKEDMLFLSQKQDGALKKINESISSVRQYLKNNYSLDFINLALKESLDDLGRISGEIFSQEILEDIFSNFCIGK